MHCDPLFRFLEFMDFIPVKSIDLLAILQKSLDRALFLYIFIDEIRSSGVRASITYCSITRCRKHLGVNKAGFKIKGGPSAIRDHVN